MHPYRRRLLTPAILVAILIGATLWQLYQGPTARVIPTQAGAPVAVGDEINLLARLIAAEAGDEPYEGQVAVAATILNRVASPLFPSSISGVVFEPWAFESVHNGLIWQVTNLASPSRAAADALNGWDPTGGALFFWNPGKPVSPWIWSRAIITQIGNHVFAL